MDDSTNPTDPHLHHLVQLPIGVKMWSDCGDERIAPSDTEKRRDEEKKTGMVTVKGRQARQQRRQF
jgi:hypothetical protein